MTRITTLAFCAVTSLMVNQPAFAALGDLLDSYSLSQPPFSIPVGLENDGADNLLVTDIGADFFTTIDTTGVVQGPTYPVSGNPIGITILDGSIYITNTDADTVDEYTSTGTFVDSFSVSAQTTFPEGITVDPISGNLFVVGGSGENTVFEYTPDGTLVDSFPVLGSSPDGLAYDPNSDTFWLYDSGTNTVRHYDLEFNELESFTASGGTEGLAVVGDRLYLMSTVNTLYEYDISDAVDLSGTALFRVTKTFTNGHDGEVDVMLRCNGGTPLEQSFTIAGDGPGVTFTVTNVPETGADCEITESGGPDGYTSSFDNGMTSLTSCAFESVRGGRRSCVITNTPNPSEFVVDIDFDGIDDPTIDLGWDLEVVCTPAADAADDTTFPGVTFNQSGTGSYMNTFTFFAEPEDGTDCTATLSGLSTAIEQDSPCTIEEIAVGEADDPDTDASEAPTCSIMATAFYEGIPTLNQYGLALMALLMLGVGFIGFRRFV